MKKHPDCEDRCQIAEHKGYPACAVHGIDCSYAEAVYAEEQRANDWANSAIKRDQISRFTGPENDLDCVGRPLRAGT